MGDLEGTLSYTTTLFLGGGCETGVTSLTGYFVGTGFFDLVKGSS
jgi:hypothetical protein